MMNNKVLAASVFTAMLACSLPAAAEHSEEHKLAEVYGCVACHSGVARVVKGKKTALPIGPSFKDMAERFHNNKHPDAYQDLFRIVKYGSSPYSSKWKGKISGLAMPPNDDTISDLDINRLLVWMLTEEAGK